MLLYKAWLESRQRFFIAVLSLSAVGMLYVYLHPILIPQWTLALHDPKAIKPAWLSKGVYDYRFYVWHFLFDYQFQEIWVLFALVLSVGGLSSEYKNGAIHFSLGIPVSRSAWVKSRFFVLLMEGTLASLIPILVVTVSSRSFGLNYSLWQAISHSMLLAVAGSVFEGLGILLSTLLRAGYYLAIVVIIFGIGLPYMIIQEYVRESGETSWLYYMDISHVMAGPWLLGWANIPWAGILISLLLTTFFIWLSIRISKVYDY